MADEQSTTISLIGMADRPTGLENYTTSVATLQRGVQKVFPQPGSGTVFQDSIVDSIKGIRARKNPRRALLVITADGPDFSNVPYQRTLEVLAASGTTLHVLRISPNGGSMRDEPARDRSYVIDFDRVQPGARGRGEVKGDAWMAGRGHCRALPPRNRNFLRTTKFRTDGESAGSPSVPKNHRRKQ